MRRSRIPTSYFSLQRGLQNPMRIAISTGGGDAPGLNAVIRAAVLSAINRGWDVLGIKRGFAGLLGEDEVIPLTKDSVRGIGHLGGTILRTTNRGNPFCYPRKQEDGSYIEYDRSDELLENARALGIDAVISIGGDGSLDIANRLAKKGMKIIGVPKTIDNDVSGTVTTFGFDTAVNTALEAIDKLHTTAESHDRVMVMEVMGREAGFIALHSGVAGSADVILIPEIPFSVERIAAKIAEREAARRRFSIIVVAEGARAAGGAPSYVEGTGRYGGIADSLAVEIEQATGKETRPLTLGHIQRGGTPVPYDRNLALRFGAAAVRAVEMGSFGCMVGLQGRSVRSVPLGEALSEIKRVPADGEVVRTARRLGVSFGD
jgi:ATP-dependent phosphofructokinase / diphosphate-dependent phosphofructokinase